MYNPLEILIYLIEFAVFAVLQSIAINGIKIAMEGEEEELPNGKIKLNGNILYPLYRLLTKKGIEKKVYFSGSPLIDLMNYIKNSDEAPKGLIVTQTSNTELSFECRDYEIETIKSIVQSVNVVAVPVGMKSTFMGKDNATVYRFSFYKKYETYLIPEWIQFPLGKCVKCMASFYGALTFFPIAIFIFGFNWYLLPVYLFDVCILAYLNFYFYKKT